VDAPSYRIIQWATGSVGQIAIRHIAEADGLAHARARLAPFKVPKAFALVEALPKNASGTLLKRDLREQFAHLAADIDGGRATAASGASPTGGER
jgi:fatty-acyl-CoA synthase